MTQPHDQARRPYYPELDGVRAVAALMVILFHMAQMGIPIRGFSAFGETGVDLFFVLSGFLITGILLKVPERSWAEVRTFYLRRSLRIFPLYYGYLILAAVVGVPISGWFWVYLQNVPISMGAPMGGIGHFWSLAVEEQFYLVWPFLVLFLPRRWLERTLWSMLVLTVVCRMLLVGHVEVYYLTLTRLDGLAAGALLALFQYGGRLERMRGWMTALAGLSMTVMAWQWVHFHGAGRPVVQVTKFSLLAAFYASAVGLLLTSRRGPATAWLASKPMRFVGRISYGLYVFHPQVLRFCFAHLRDQPAAVKVLFGSVATLAISLLSWHLLERPFLRLKDRVAPEPVPAHAASRSAPPLRTVGG